MKLSQIEKRIPQTLTNSKDVIQKGREYARRSSWARSTRGQENEAWALYQKNPSRVSWVDLSRERYIALPKLATPAGNTFARRLLFTWDKRDSPKQTICSSARVKMRKKEPCKRWCLHFTIFLTPEKFEFSKRKSLIGHDYSDNRWLINWVTKTHPPSTPVENCHPTWWNTHLNITGKQSLQFTWVVCSNGQA